MEEEEQPSTQVSSQVCGTPRGPHQSHVPSQEQAGLSCVLGVASAPVVLGQLQPGMASGAGTQRRCGARGRTRREPPGGRLVTRGGHATVCRGGSPLELLPTSWRPPGPLGSPSRQCCQSKELAWWSPRVHRVALRKPGWRPRPETRLTQLAQMGHMALPPGTCTQADPDTLREDRASPIPLSCRP